MFTNQTLQEKYSRILEHLTKIDGVISETLRLAHDCQDLTGTTSEALDSSMDSSDSCDRVETIDDNIISMGKCTAGSLLVETKEEIGEQENCEMDKVNSEVTEVSGKMTEVNCEMTEDSEMIEAESEMCEPDSDSRAVSEEDVAYEGPEIVIDAQDEAETEEKNETEENTT